MLEFYIQLFTRTLEQIWLSFTAISWLFATLSATFLNTWFAYHSSERLFSFRLWRWLVFGRAGSLLIWWVNYKIFAMFRFWVSWSFLNFFKIEMFFRFVLLLMLDLDSFRHFVEDWGLFIFNADPIESSGCSKILA